MIYLHRKRKDQNYTRFGYLIPFKEIELDNKIITFERMERGEKKIEEIKYTPLKAFFLKSPLSEEKLLNALRMDDAVDIETDRDREARLSREKAERESTSNYKHEKNTEKADRIRGARAKIEKLNEEKEEAQKTSTLKDDIAVEKKLNKAEKEFKEVIK